MNLLSLPLAYDLSYCFLDYIHCILYSTGYSKGQYLRVIFLIYFKSCSLIDSQGLLFWVVQLISYLGLN